MKGLSLVSVFLLWGSVLSGCHGISLDPQQLHQDSEDAQVTVPCVWGDVAPVVWGGPNPSTADLPSGYALYVSVVGKDGAINLSENRTERRIRFCIWNCQPYPVFLKNDGNLVLLERIDMRSPEGIEHYSGGGRVVKGYAPTLNDSDAVGHYVLLNGTDARISGGGDAYEFTNPILDRRGYPVSWTGTVNVTFVMEGYTVGDSRRFNATLSKTLPVASPESPIKE